MKTPLLLRMGATGAVCALVACSTPQNHPSSIQSSLNFGMAANQHHPLTCPIVPPQQVSQMKPVAEVLLPLAVEINQIKISKRQKSAEDQRWADAQYLSKLLNTQTVKHPELTANLPKPKPEVSEEFLKDPISLKYEGQQLTINAELNITRSLPLNEIVLPEVIVPSNEQSSVVTANFDNTNEFDASQLLQPKTENEAVDQQIEIADAGMDWEYPTFEELEEVDSHMWQPDPFESDGFFGDFPSRNSSSEINKIVANLNSSWSTSIDALMALPPDEEQNFIEETAVFDETPTFEESTLVVPLPPLVPPTVVATNENKIEEIPPHEVKASKPEVTYGVPLVMNKRVKQSLSFYTKRGRRSLIVGLQRSGKYMPIIRQILREENVPEDLAYLAAIESNFNPRARSIASAVGMWQFIPATGRHYKLTQNQWIDERMDVLKSTRAAARYLGYLHKLFNNWELALASYNAGEGRVQRAIKYAKRRKRKTDYWSLHLPKETKRYVANFMAVMYISKNLEKYNLQDVKYDKPMSTDTMTVSTDYSLKEIANRSKVSFKKLVSYNPAFKRALPPLNKMTYDLYLPSEAQETLKASLAKSSKPQIPWKNKMVLRDRSTKMTRLLTSHGSPVYFRVRSGDNLWNLAKKHNTTVARLQKWNNLKKNSVLRIKQKLKVYVPNWKVFDQLIDQPIQLANKGKLQKITVRPGDTLSKISKKYRVSVRKLMRWNKLSRATSLKAYQKLIVSMPNG